MEKLPNGTYFLLLNEYLMSLGEYYLLQYLIPTYWIIYISIFNLNERKDYLQVKCERLTKPIVVIKHEIDHGHYTMASK